MNIIFHVDVLQITYDILSIRPSIDLAINMLGDQITDLKGKIIGQRVLDAEGPTIETSISSKGTVKGIQINESLTYVGKPASPGVLHGIGQGVIMSGESDTAPYTGEGIGRISQTGIKWRGAVFFTSGSTGKLQFLNNMVVVFEAEVDSDGNFSEKSWEWK